MADVDVGAATNAYACRRCGNPLGDSPSDFFCGERCQTEWYTAVANPPAPPHGEPHEEVVAETAGPESDRDQWWAAGRRPAA